MNPLLDRFLRYVKIDTQSDESSTASPSTEKQLELCRLLVRECEALGLADVSLDEYGVVMAMVPATVAHEAPTIAWLAHVDTSPEYSGSHVKPAVHENYDGRDLHLAGDPTQVIRVAENPHLSRLVGGTIITTDGTTLLGADDKAGVAVIMSAAAHLVAHPDIPHGPIRLCFTCDEEIGRGVKHLDLDKLGAICGYTLDGDGAGKVDCETFSADQTVIRVTGVNIHPSIGKGAMVNALRIVCEFIARLPKDRLSPETTAGREGFLHPYQLEAGVAQASCRMILRDFDTPRLGEYAALLESIAADLCREHPRAKVEVEIRKQYRNLGDGLQKEPRALSLALEATRAAGLEPEQSIIRGGTDGAILTERGLPTPNLSTGEHNPHSPLEWTSVEEMQQAVDVLVQLAILWGRDRVSSSA
ncbi:MAG: peptidase T [Planctomycetes bacterium]|nr:peptidase T [Planctomycetota bacterium]